MHKGTVFIAIAVWCASCTLLSAGEDAGRRPASLGSRADHAPLVPPALIHNLGRTRFRAHACLQRICPSSLCSRTGASQATQQAAASSGQRGHCR